jgi:hypothetical protein
VSVVCASSRLLNSKSSELELAAPMRISNIVRLPRGHVLSVHGFAVKASTLLAWSPRQRERGAVPPHGSFSRIRRLCSAMNFRVSDRPRRVPSTLNFQGVTVSLILAERAGLPGSGSGSGRSRPRPLVAVLQAFSLSVARPSVSAGRSVDRRNSAPPPPSRRRWVGKEPVVRATTLAAGSTHTPRCRAGSPACPPSGIPP